MSFPFQQFSNEFQMVNDVDGDNHAALRKYNWIIVPIVNPDGYEYTWTNDRFAL